MESWCYDSVEKGYAVSNETVSLPDSTARAKNVLMGWKLKSPCGNNSRLIRNAFLVSGQQGIENQGFMEVGFPEMMRKQSLHDSTRNVFSANDSGGGDIVNPNLVTSNAVSGDEESSSKFSSAVVNSNSRESSLIDLQLGRFGGNPNSNSSRRAPILSSAELSTPAKRIRAAGVNTQPAFCQVYGCNKDLSSSKDYHKRHKVCEAHSKTAKVIVNGLEQRFCQQCSRFHLLAEFDDGKRSCRKRLAGHNERRRKPHIALHSSRTGRLLHSSCGSGSKFQRTPLMASSFIHQDILPQGPVPSQKFEITDWCKDIKRDRGANFAPKSTTMCMNRALQQISVFPPAFGKQYTLFTDSINNTATGSIFNQNIAQYPHDASSRSLFHSTSLSSEDFSHFDKVSAVHGLSGLSESSCALSLLSSQAQNSSAHSSGMPMSHSLITPSNSSYYNFSEVSEKLFGLSSQDMASGLSNKCPLYRANSAGRNHLNLLPILGTGEIANSEFVNGILQGSEFANVKDHLSCEDGHTIDLLQLSSQLQQVEHQRPTVPVKQENEAFCCLRIT
ncbi:hypothetical protein Ancab_038764 [Ancistrocladus abbreviatus]